jgi:hypothetical protein
MPAGSCYLFNGGGMLKLISLLVAVYQGTTNEKWFVAYMLGALAFILAFYLAKRGVK